MAETITRSGSKGDPDLQPSRRSVLQGLSGALAAGMVLLLLIVIGAQLYFQMGGFPGLGWAEIGLHAGVATVVLFLQRFADRRSDAASTVASLGVLVLVAAVLWWFWWA